MTEGLSQGNTDPIIYTSSDLSFLKDLYISHYILDVFYVILCSMSLTILCRGLYNAIRERFSARKGYTPINGNSSSYTVLPGTENRVSNHIPTAASVVNKEITFKRIFEC